MDAPAIPSLEDLAFEVSFKDILSTLLLCYEHRPEVKQLSWLNPSAFSNLFLTSDKLRRFVRNRLDHNLKALVGVQARTKYVKKFYDIFSEDNVEHQIYIWVFLDAVLDESFKELEITLLAFPGSALCTKLIPTIAKWSPRLEKLTVNCKIRETDYSSGECEELQSFILSLGFLQHLTQLSLLEIKGSARLKVLSLIGKACPLLTHFTIDGAFVYKKHILALILGESDTDLMDLNKPLPSWCKGEALEHLVIPGKFLSPICYSLQELKFNTGTSKSNEIRKSEAAFALRHLPLLRVVDKRFPASLAVTSLHNNTANVIEARKSQEKFQKTYLEASDGLENETQLPSLRNSVPLSGQLLLTKLDYNVNVKYEAMVRAVGAMCPMLKEVTFCIESYESDLHMRQLHPMVIESTADPETFKSILSGWPKLTSIGFLMGVPLEYMTPILEVFGPGLLHLEFHCRNIKLADLGLCSQLKNLRILSYDTVLIPFKVDFATFLLELMSFESNSCLGSCSRFFEEKSTLVRLVLNCSHVEIQYTAQTGSRSKFNRISQLWSKLEVFAVWGYSKLSMPVMSDLIPHLGSLKLITLPWEIGAYDPLLHQSMRDHLLGRRPPAKIHFEEFKRRAKCQLV